MNESSSNSNGETSAQKHELDLLLESTVQHLQTIASIKKVASVKGISYQISITQLNKYPNLRNSSSVETLSDNYMKLKDFMIKINKDICAIRDTAVKFYEEQERDESQIADSLKKENNADEEKKDELKEGEKEEEKEEVKEDTN